MKRKKQILLGLLIVGVLGFAHIRVQDLFFSPKAVYAAYEKGCHREPYEGIVLEYERENGKMLVGRQPDGLIFVPVEQRGIFWTWREEGKEGLVILDEEVDGRIIDWKRFIGLCKNPEITEVTCVYGQWDENGIWRLRKSSGRVEKNGIIFLEIDLPENEPAGYFLEGRNKEGELLCVNGFDESMIRDAKEGRVIWLDEK